MGPRPEDGVRHVRPGRPTDPVHVVAAGSRRPSVHANSHRPQQNRRRGQDRTRPGGPARALLLVIKAKLEAITAGIATVDEEFLAYIVIPGTTSTVSERVGRELARAYEVTGYTPMLALPGGRPEPA